MKKQQYHPKTVGGFHFSCVRAKTNQGITETFSPVQVRYIPHLKVPLVMAAWSFPGSSRHFRF